MPPGGKTRILIADDEKTLRDVLALHLRGLGFEVFEAGDGAEALQMAQQVMPALVVLDITMPLMNGWDVARQLRSDEATSQIKLLMLSGIGSAVLGSTVPALGGDIGLDKPFELDELDAALETLLGPSASWQAH
jgi:DNA-binding response OmpR family regulator